MKINGSALYEIVTNHEAPLVIVLELSVTERRTTPQSRARVGSMNGEVSET